MNDNKKVILTGCNGGIGRAISTRLKSDGFQIIGLDRYDQCQWVDYYYCVDFTSHDMLKIALAMIADRHRQQLYGLINNAGLYQALEFQTLTLQEYERVMAVNLRAPLFLSQWFSAMLDEKEQPGAIINITSISAEYGSPDVAYGVSKGGLLNLSKSLLTVLPPRIRVNSVSPGVIETPMAQAIPEDRLAGYQARIANGRPGRAEDVANAVAFLLSEGSEYINGATLDVNGGFH